jgi:hypothetical protein
MMSSSEATRTLLARDLVAHGVSDEVLVPVRPGGQVVEVEVSERCREVEELNVRQEGAVVGKGR